MYGRLFKDIHLVKLDTLAMLANDLLKVNNAINTYLITLCHFMFSHYIYMNIPNVVNINSIILIISIEL